MENIVYYFGSNTDEANLNKIVSDPLFMKIVSYLIERQGQEVILRQIKSDIPTNSNLELYLDKLIKHKLLERENRRYTLSFPIYFKDETQLQVSDSIKKALQMIINEGIHASYFLFGEWLWSLLFEEENGDYFFGLEFSSESFPVFFSRIEEGDANNNIVSIFADNIIPFDLANYFFLLSKRSELPKQFEPLQHLIGDVDINYFIPQIQKVIRSAKRNKSDKSKMNIFQETLLLTGDLKRSNDGQIYFSTPILKDYMPSAVVQESLDTLESELSLLWESIEDQNLRVLFKKQLYSLLFSDYFPNTNSFHYFK
ncbi:DUF1803 domain-containing protein [Enterococcus quebecensis]|uniref:DUF1803 domain-containing protein n=1 Tax=Enterococcus quebecensis TaxID=903983 RepID=A0A1E5H0Y3_9ENTE|nr:DUF1803 domain-containing protein [Enterococcus quebecensis]OEG18556.1 hypothetical protein BCR23_13385 [Enterococcus quebecensis]